MKSAYNQCRDRCFLVPSWIILDHALPLIRRRWAVKHLTNVEINRKYSSHWTKILQKAYPQWPGATAKMFRRFFAVYAYHYFGKSTFLEGNQSSSSLNGFATWMLGHATLDDQVIAYSSLVLNPKPKLKLFELGTNLKVQNSRREKVLLSNRKNSTKSGENNLA